MPVCKVGCDDFYEKGYIIIDQKGTIKLNENITYSSDLQLILNNIVGKFCTHFNSDTAQFFEYKRKLFR